MIVAEKTNHTELAQDQAVVVDHVSMHFNMAADNINSIREYLTKLTKKSLSARDKVF